MMCITIELQQLFSVRGNKLLENESILGIYCWHNDHI
uniref:Uncharacterized protein n=1 Tax=Anguilla anguilla TaxID=7936 RepID=A0A0E9VVP2_ANGAN